MKFFYKIAIGFILVICTACANGHKYRYIPPNGYVPDSETAIKIAIAVWIPIYGKNNIENQKPYNADLHDGVWHVTGSLPGPQNTKDKNGKEIVVFTVGGVAEAEISQKTGEIFKIIHGE